MKFLIAVLGLVILSMLFGLVCAALFGFYGLIISVPVGFAIGYFGAGFAIKHGFGPNNA